MIIGITEQQIISWEALPYSLWIRKLIRWKKKTCCGLIFLTVVYISLNILSQESMEECEKGKNTKMCVPANVLVLDTPTCKIGLPKLWPPEFKSTWRDWLSSSDKTKAPICNQERKLFYYVKPDHVINVTYQDFRNCSVREVIRNPAAKNDNYYLEVNQINLTTSRIVDVAHMEMFEVVCDKYYNFEANLHVKPNVKEKMDFWSKRKKLKIKTKVKHAVNTNETVLGTGNTTNNVTIDDDFEERPINVLWLGIDTTSAIHVQRSFPKTLNVLKEMGFIDFPGFHSLGLMTVTNFVAYFLGASWGMLYKGGCDRINEGPWDTCPFIWKEFEKRNYVSMFIEDDEGAFNYLKDDDGFIKPPVDYYLHPLFLAHKERRESLPKIRRDCMSTETVPQYLLRYTERFLQKFNSTPFFSFTWFNYPFHDLSFSLQNVDGDFEKFYRKLQRDPNLLENTLLILNGDHGERYGVYQRKSIDAILEKSLPPLYIRIPEKLLRRYPHLRLKTFAESNRHRLVTGFDIHHTLLHVLSLSDELANLTQYLEEKQNKSKTNLNNTNSNTTTTKTILLQKFKPVLVDRSSLFSRISENRTCNTVHIENRMCVCNTHKATKLVTNPFEISRMITHTVEHINSFIGHGTGYEKFCKVWNYAYFPLISADVLEKKGNSSLVHLMFKTDPVARFEIKLRITMSGTIGGSSTIKSVSEPVRISSYGNTTWCIPTVPEKVKRMKEFCSCKKNAPKWKIENSKMKH